MAKLGSLVRPEDGEPSTWRWSRCIRLFCNMVAGIHLPPVPCFQVWWRAKVTWGVPPGTQQLRLTQQTPGVFQVSRSRKKTGSGGVSRSKGWIVVKTVSRNPASGGANPGIHMSLITHGVTDGCGEELQSNSGASPCSKLERNQPGVSRKTHGKKEKAKELCFMIWASLSIFPFLAFSELRLMCNSTGFLEEGRFLSPLVSCQLMMFSFVYLLSNLE